MTTGGNDNRCNKRQLRGVYCSGGGGGSSDYDISYYSSVGGVNCKCLEDEIK